MEQVSVILASSNKGLTQSLRKVLELEKWIRVVGTPHSKAATVDLSRKTSPQVVVVDYDLVGASPEIGDEIREASPNAKIIMLSVYDYVGRVTVKVAPHSGAPEAESVEWLSKQSSPADLLRSISQVRKRRARRIH